MPEANIIFSYYLNHALPTANVCFGRDFSKVLSKDQSSNEFDFMILHPDEMNKIDNNAIDMVVNTRSMMEMNYTTLINYFRHINRIIRSEGVFYSLNRYQKVSFLKQYPFGSKWKILRSVAWPRYIDMNPHHELLLKKIEYNDANLGEILASFPPKGLVNIKHALKSRMANIGIKAKWKGNAI